MRLMNTCMLTIGVIPLLSIQQLKLIFLPQEDLADDRPLPALNNKR